MEVEENEINGILLYDDEEYSASSTLVHIISISINTVSIINVSLDVSNSAVMSTDGVRELEGTENVHALYS